MNSVEQRRAARRATLEVLYEMDTTTHAVDGVLDYRLRVSALPEEAEAFVRTIVNGVLTHAKKLDAMVQTHAPEFPTDQLAVVDRAILRIAIYELAIREDPKLAIIINEAVELGKTYGSDSSPRFVNGVLGSIVKTYDDIAAQFEED